MRTGSSDDELRPLEPETDPSPWRLLFEIPLLIGMAALIAIVVKAFVAQAFSIPSASMEPQLTAGDRVVVSRLAYDLHEPRRGDVVVFHDPNAEPEDDDAFILERYGRDALEAVGVLRPDETELIKRVIALPGETVEARQGRVYVDDRPVMEPYLEPDVVTTDFGPVSVPEDHLFVLGDNRPHSQDSRVFGTIPADSVVGRAIARVWPPGRVAYL